MRRANRRSRSAFSLLEVLVAMAIFFGALAAIGQLAALGMRAARAADLETQAQFACETKLAEALAGLEPIGDATGELRPLGDPPGWLYAIERIEAPSGQAGVRVRVRQDLPEDRRAVEFELVRWLPGVPASPDSDAEAGSSTGSAENSLGASP